MRDHYEVPDGAGFSACPHHSPSAYGLERNKANAGAPGNGERAEAFVRNPFAVLGPDASDVIDEKQFEGARLKAGISFARFTAHLQHDGPDSELKVSLLIEEGDVHTGSSHVLPFACPAELREFIAKMEERRGREAQCCSWHGYELEILGDTPDQLAILAGALQKWGLK